MDDLKSNKENLEQMGYSYDDIMNRGIEKGVKKGMKQGIMKNNNEVATKLKAESVSVDIISRCTGLSIKEIEKL